MHVLLSGHKEFRSVPIGGAVNDMLGRLSIKEHREVGQRTSQEITGSRRATAIDAIAAIKCEIQRRTIDIFE